MILANIHITNGFLNLLDFLIDVENRKFFIQQLFLLEAIVVHWYQRFIVYKNKLLHVGHHENIQQSMLHLIFIRAEKSLGHLFDFFVD